MIEGRAGKRRGIVTRAAIIRQFGLRIDQNLDMRAYRLVRNTGSGAAIVTRVATFAAGGRRIMIEGSRNETAARRMTGIAIPACRIGLMRLALVLDDHRAVSAQVSVTHRFDVTVFAFLGSGIERAMIKCSGTLPGKCLV